MDMEDMRESGDEQDDQDDQEDDLEEEMEPLAIEPKEPEPSGEESRQENRPTASAKSSKHNRNKSRTENCPSHSRLLNHPQSKRHWRSANAFINFVQDFKKDYPDMTVGRNIFQICGERWKSMSEEQKQPYISAAQSVKRLKQRKTGEVTDQLVKKSVTRVSKRKTETKRKETIQKRSKENKRDAKNSSDTDTATTTVHSSMSEVDSS